MTDGPRATICYGSNTYSVPAEVGESLVDVLYGLDELGGSHVFRFGGGGEDPTVRLFISPGVPVSVQFDAGYETPKQRENYVETHLKTEARFRLGLEPVTEDPQAK